MNIGYLTGFSAEEPKRAKRLGFDCIEVHSASWGTDTVFTDAAARSRILDDLKRSHAEAGITISAIAHYGPGLHLKNQELLHSFKNVIDIAAASGTRLVTTIAPRTDPTKGIADNIPAFRETYTIIARIAEDAGVKVAFENWPWLGGYPVKGGTMAYCPEAWGLMFDAVPSLALGLEFDPSHLYWQGIDHMAALTKFADRVYHVHAKDTEIFPHRRNVTGIYGPDWWTYRIPGLGEINWTQFIAGLYNIGYDGGICIEHEDDRFDGNRKDADPARFEQGLRIGLATLRPLVG